jgi:drug/metabolite transporter (DMT)-like permease
VPPFALLLILGAAVCHSVWNLLVKTEPRRVEVTFGALLVGALLTSPALTVYSVTEIGADGWALVALSGVFETAYMLGLAAAYGAGELSLVYPVARGTAPVVVAPLAVALLGERLTPPGLAGIGLVVLGIFVGHAGIGRSWGGGNGRALALALFTGLATAGYSLVNKVGVSRVPVPLYAGLVFLVDALLLGLVLTVRGQPVWPFTPRGPWRRTLAVGALMMAAYLAVLHAMSLAPVAYVVAAREVSIVVAALLGALALGERHPIARVAGALVIFLGLALMAFTR